MIKLQIIGNLAHNNRLFDSTCKQCGGIYSRMETAVCPRCGNSVVPITAKNGRAMMVSEGTIYPLITQDQKDIEIKARSKRKNSMEIIYRFVVLSFADAETGIVSEPRIHPYLTKGRQVMIEINHNPIISWFKANDGSIKCEVRLGILPNGGDFIKLLGKKEAMRNLTIPENSVPTTQAIPMGNVNDQLLKMKAQIDSLLKAQPDVAAEVTGTGKPKPMEVGGANGVALDNGMIIGEEPDNMDPF